MLASLAAKAGPESALGKQVAAEREAVLAAGARLAEPGEFTRRAFLNGRMDLTQAEAVCDLIRSRTERAAHVARAQLDGALGGRVAALYEAVTAVCAEVEHLLDFDEGELPPLFTERASERLAACMTEMEQLVASWREGHLVREGALVVLAGRPNAGKSSLMNALLGIRRAIVHDLPGTTRDAIEESLVLYGVPLRLVDTAGLRDTQDGVEREGVDQPRITGCPLRGQFSGRDEPLHLALGHAKSLCSSLRRDGHDRYGRVDDRLCPLAVDDSSPESGRRHRN